MIAFPLRGINLGPPGWCRRVNSLIIAGESSPSSFAVLNVNRSLFYSIPGQLIESTKGNVSHFIGKLPLVEFACGVKFGVWKDFEVTGRSSVRVIMNRGPVFVSNLVCSECELGILLHVTMREKDVVNED